MNTVPVVLAVVFGYLSICIGISVFALRRTGRGIGEYYVAGGHLGAFVTAMTTLATFFSTYAFLGLAGLNYVVGYGYNALEFACYPFCILGYFLIGKRFFELSRLHRDWVTPCDMIASRFDCNIPNRLIIGLGNFLIPSIFYIAMQLVGCSLILSALTGGEISYLTFLLVFALIMAIYVAIGGMRGVAYTDVFQGFLFLAVAGVIMSLVSTKFGGLGAMWQALAKSENSHILELGVPPLYIATFAPAIFPWVAIPQLWVKTYAAKDKRAIYGMGIATAVAGCVVTGGLTLVVSSALGLHFPVAPAGVPYDQLFPMFLTESIGPIFASVLLTGAVSAGMSTADTILLVLSSIIGKDILQSSAKLKLSEAKMTLLCRILSILVIGISVVGAINPGAGIVRTCLALTFPGYVMLLIPILLMLFWKRANKYGLIAGVVAGLLYNALALFVVWPTWPHNPWGVYEGVPGIFITGAVMVIVSLLTPPTKAEVISGFFGEK